MLLFLPQRNAGCPDTGFPSRHCQKDPMPHLVGRTVHYHAGLGDRGTAMVKGS